MEFSQKQPVSILHISAVERSILLVSIILAFGPLKDIFAGVDTTITGIKSEYSYYDPVTFCLTLAWIRFTFVPGIGGTSGSRLFFLCFPLSLMLFVDVTSCIWSTDIYDSTKQTILLFNCLLLCATTVARLGAEQALKLTFEALFIVCIASLFWVIVFPRSGIHNLSDALQNFHAGRWRGVYGHKNLLGQAAAMLLILSSCTGSFVGISATKRFMAIILSLVLLFNAESASSIVTVVAATAAYGVLSFHRFYRFVLCGSICMLLLLFQSAGLNLVGITADILGRDATLTGRTDVWIYSLDSIARFWPFGLGYGNTNGFSSTLQNDLGEAIVNTHNAFLEILVTTGILGAVFLVVFLFYVSKLTIGAVFSKDDVRKCASVLVLAWTFAGISEVSPMEPNNLVFVCGTISFFILFLARTRVSTLRAEYSV